MPRFSNIKFNLLKALELFGDMNHDEMDVRAPPSSHDFFKEYQVARRLNDCLNQLYREGFFDDCDLREVDSTTDEDYDDDAEEEEEEEAAEGSNRPTPRSEGFSVDERDLDDGSQSTGHESKESLSHRFKRYIRRILPGRRGSSRRAGGRQQDYEEDEEDSGQMDDEEEEEDEENYDPDSVMESDEPTASGSGRRSRSRSGSRARSGSGERRPRSASSSSSSDRRSGRSASSRSTGSRPAARTSRR